MADTTSDFELQVVAADAARRTGGNTKVQAVMAEYGITHLSRLPQYKRPEFIARLDAL